MGANRFSKFSVQYVLESIILSIIALGFSIGIVELIIPAIKGIDPSVEKVFNISLNLKIYAIFLVFSIFVGFIAGIFPAIYLSAFNPVKVLKGVIKVKLFAGLTLRKILIGIQFTFGIIFIMLTVLLIKQVIVI